MKLHHSNTSRFKKPVFVVVSILLLSVGYVGVAFGYSWWPFPDKTDNFKSATPEEITNGETIKTRNIEDGDSKQSSGSTPLPDPSPSEDGGKPTVDAQITAVNVDTSMLRIRVLIQSITNSGMCILTLTKEGVLPYSLSADVQSLPNGTTCEGFDIPLSELSSGVWTANVEFENDSIRATTSEEITVP